MTNIQNSGKNEIADALKSFTEAVLENAEITSELKNELIQNLSFISQQVSIPEGARNQSVIKSVLSGIKEGVSVTTSLVTLWTKVEPIFKGIFGL